MMKLLKIFFLGFVFTLFSNASFAEEFWVCDGFRGGTVSDPFLLRGTHEQYYWKNLDLPITIKKVAENNINHFDIYVTVDIHNAEKEEIKDIEIYQEGDDLNFSYAYYIQKNNHSEIFDGKEFFNQSKSLKLTMFRLDRNKGITNCYRQ